MATQTRRHWLTSWTTLTPPIAVIALALSWGRHPGGVFLAIDAALLLGAVLTAVHHAEVIAHKVGEPFGSLILAVAVTIIEVGLIVTLMVSYPGDNSTLARDTVFAAVMITLNGVVGLSLVVGAVKHHLAVFNPEGTGSALSTVVALAVLTMVLPTFTTSEPGPIFSPAQLAFAAIASLVLYGMFVFTQTVRHRDFFLPDKMLGSSSGEDAHADPPTSREAWRSVGLLMAALLAVVGLTKVLSGAIEDAVEALGLPKTFVGVVIALMVLLPETIAAVRAAGRDHVQISFNLAYGSAMASIGLTIPTIALATIWVEGPLVLGLGSTQMVLLVLSVVVSILTVVPGRAKPLAGGIHLVLLSAFLFLSIKP